MILEDSRVISQSLTDLSLEPMPKMQLAQLSKRVSGLSLLFQSTSKRATTLLICTIILFLSMRMTLLSSVTSSLPLSSLTGFQESQWCSQMTCL